MALLLSQITTVYLPRTPIYSPRIVVTWDQFWSQNLQQTTLTPVARPFSQLDWPVPRPPARDPTLLFWTSRVLTPVLLPLSFDWGTPDSPEYAQALRTWIGTKGREVEQAPFSQDDWPLPQSPRYPIQTWISPSPITLSPSLNIPFKQLSWPLPQAPLQPIQTWVLDSPIQLSASLGITFKQLDWPLTPAPVPAINLRTWAWQYNLNLIGQDLLPYNQKDWPVPRPPLLPIQTWIYGSPIQLTPSLNVPFKQLDWLLTPAPIPPINIKTWTWQYNLNLIGQDFFPPGKDWFDLAPRGPQQPLYGFTQSPNLPVITIPATPFAQDDWPLPNRGPLQPLYGFTASYNLSLIGQDALPKGEQVTELPPRGYEYAISLRSWTLNLRQTTLQPLPYGVVITDRPPLGPLQPDRFWSWSYNLNLIGKDQFPTGDQYTELTPFGHIYHTQLRTWIDRRNLALDFVAGALPPTNYDWPVPKGPLQPDRFLGFSYNLNLIGKDQLPVGDQITDLWARPQAEPATRTWAFTYNPNLRGQDRLPTGARVTDLAPRDHQRSIQLRSWERAYNPNLIGQDRLPNRQLDWPLTPAAQRANELATWIAQTKLLLVPPAITVRPFDWGIPVGPEQPDRGWVQSTNLSLLTFVAPPLPFNQYSWPLTPAPKQPTQIFTATYNKNLIGKDIITAYRQTDWPLPQGWRARSGGQPWIDWVKGTNPNILKPTPPIPFNQYWWPLPGRHPIPAQQAVFWEASLYQPPFVPPIPPIPPPTPPEPSSKAGVPGIEWQFYDRAREPGPIGWR